MLRYMTMKRLTIYCVALLLLAGVCASCSPKGVSMPRHRKHRHCDCPTFSQRLPESAAAWDDDGIQNS